MEMEDKMVQIKKSKKDKGSNQFCAHFEKIGINKWRHLKVDGLCNANWYNTNESYLSQSLHAEIVETTFHSRFRFRALKEPLLIEINLK